MRKSGVATCLIQIVNKPDKVTLLKVLHASCILLPVKCLVELITEVR